MSDDELLVPRWLIEPEPTAAEFLAIFTAMQRPAEIEPGSEDPLDSPWARTARREQLRNGLDDTGNGWNR
jgi:hypothetical protein